VRPIRAAAGAPPIPADPAATAAGQPPAPAVPKPEEMDTLARLREAKRRARGG
jgi:hypothetical protein